MTDSPESEGPNGITRRSFLGKALAALGLAVVGGATVLENQPSLAQQEEEKLWREFNSNPQKFLAEHKGIVLENLVVKEEGVNLRKSPTARDASNIVGKLPPKTEIPVAMYASRQESNDPDGPWASTQIDGQVTFFSKKFTESNPQINVVSTQPTIPTNPEPSK